MRTLAELICAAAGRLCRQLWLLAGVILLCTVLPVLAGRGAQQLLSQGVSFSGITLAVTAPEGDGTPQLLERYLGQLTDIRQYCTFEAMAYQLAKDMGAMHSVLSGKTEAVVLTGGMANSKKLVERIAHYAGYIAPFVLFPGEFEMEAMAKNALLALKNGTAMDY